MEMDFDKEKFNKRYNNHENQAKSNERAQISASGAMAIESGPKQPTKQTSQNQSRFDTNANLTDALRARIESWATNTPTSQFQQYGPLNVYFFQRFPGALVKPQPKVRPTVEDTGMDEPMRLRYKAGGVVTIEEPKTDLLDKMLAGVQVEPENLQRAINLKRNYDSGIIAKASIGKDYVWNTRDSETTIPDFHICKFTGAVGQVGAVQDVVRIVVEVGSWPRTNDDFQSNLARAKTRLTKQLMNSMRALGADGDRWEGNALGVAILGTGAAFITRDNGEWKWYSTGANGEPIWFSLYSQMWSMVMDDFTNKF